MMRFLCPFCLLLLSTCPLTAQNSRFGHAGAKGVGLGYQSIVFADANAIYHNPAGLAATVESGLMFSASRNFMLGELHTFSAGIIFRSSATAVFYGYVEGFGYDQYSELAFNAGYARQISEHFSMALTFHAYRLRIREYGQTWAPDFSVGLKTQISPKLEVGAALDHPLSLSQVKGIPLPSRMSTGVRYLVSEKVDVYATIEKEIRFPANMKAGLEYRPGKTLQCRMGISTNPVTFCFGAGWAFGSGLTIDLANAWHQTLGISPAVSVGYVF